MKKQKENFHEGITWSEMGKQNVQAEKVYSQKRLNFQINKQKQCILTQYHLDIFFPRARILNEIAKFEKMPLNRKTPIGATN